MKNTRKLVVTALFSAAAYVLMLLEFPLPFIIPAFIQFDFSELPAIICSFAVGPLWGGAVCVIKNLLHLFSTSTVGAGELSNMLLGLCFVIPAGLIYKKNKCRKNALIGCLTGALLTAVLSIFINYFVTYPVYMKLFMPKEAIVGAYQALLPSVDSILEALLIFNLPFNFMKYTVISIIAFLVYKHISPIIKGTK
jgi:riboflavin transporter FmnP